MNSPSKDKTARYISIVTQAPLLIAVLLILISIFQFDEFPYPYFSLSFVLLPMVPTISIFAYSRHLNENHVEIANRKDRFLPYIVSLVSFGLLFVLISMTDGPVLFLFISSCYFVGTLLLFFVNFIYKISVHAAGISIFASIIVYVFGIPGLLSLILIPIVIWSRYYEKKHTASQLILGSIIGLTVPILLSLIYL
jgi:hypothetical protein